MKYLKLFEELYYNENGEEVQTEPLFEAETKGGRYKIVVYQSEIDKKRNKYSLSEYSNGRSGGGGSGYNKAQMNVWLNFTIEGSAKIDDINYYVKSNKGEFEILPFDKSEPYKSMNYYNKYFGIN